MVSWLESRNPILRKLTAYALQLVLRRALRILSSPDEYIARSPILVNSIPKSGTHLLMQLARAVSNTHYFGSFIAHAWSITLRERNSSQILRRLRAMVPGEVVGAHLYHDVEVARFFDELPVIHLFIFRDPRDVVLSEAYYLTEMARWHRLSPVLRSIPDEESRIQALIEGIPGLYADIGTRLRRFIGWLNNPSTITVRYEDLHGAERSRCIRRLGEVLVQRSQSYGSADSIAHRMESAIAPERSHTYHEGGIEKWRSRLSPANVERIERLAAQEITTLGYPLS